MRRIVDDKPANTVYVVANGKIEETGTVRLVLLPQESGSILLARLARGDGGFRLMSIQDPGPNTSSGPVSEGREGAYLHQWVRACEATAID